MSNNNNDQQTPFNVTFVKTILSSNILTLIALGLILLVVGGAGQIAIIGIEINISSDLIRGIFVILGGVTILLVIYIVFVKEYQPRQQSNNNHALLDQDIRERIKEAFIDTYRSKNNSEVSVVDIVSKMHRYKLIALDESEEIISVINEANLKQSITKLGSSTTEDVN